MRGALDRRALRGASARCVRATLEKRAEPHWHEFLSLAGTSLILRHRVARLPRAAACAQRRKARSSSSKARCRASASRSQVCQTQADVRARRARRAILRGVRRPRARRAARTSASAAAAPRSTPTRARRWPPSSACSRTTWRTSARCSPRRMLPIVYGAGVGLPPPRAPLGALRAEEGRRAGRLPRAALQLRRRHARAARCCRRASSALIPPLRELVGQLSIRDRLPQIEVAVGDDADVLVFRHLMPLTAGRRGAAARHSPTRTAFTSGCSRRARTARSRSIRRESDAATTTLPEFGVRIAFRPTDFTQVNHAVNRVLVSRAVRLLDPQPGERIADLFCGLGNFSLPIARARRAGDRLRRQRARWSSARARERAAQRPACAQFEVAEPVQASDLARLRAASTSCSSTRRAKARSSWSRRCRTRLAAAHRLRLLRPGDARARRRRPGPHARASGWPRRAWSTCSRTPRTSRASRCSSAELQARGSETKQIFTFPSDTAR